VTYSINSRTGTRGHVVAVGGEADASAERDLAGAVREAVRDVLATGGERFLVIDLSESTFVDSRIIGVLVRWVEDLGEKGWRVPVVCADERLLRLFRAIGLEGTFEIFPSREAAEAA
jgi:anti-sigma B factor antagonist